MKKILLVAMLFFIATSCSKKKPDPTVELDYIEAYNLLKDKDFTESAKAFEKIEDDYPFSKWAAKAQTMAVYAYFKNEDYDDVERLVEDFIRINPNHEAVDYMIYMKAMCYFVRIPNIYRAQDNTKKASITFRELKARFPESPYAIDGKMKLVVVDEHLAGAQMSVGRYQIQQKNYVGALKNFQEVAWRYGSSNQAPEAFFRMFEIYSKLGLDSEAKKAYEILAMQFPENEWTQSAQNK